MSPFNSPSQRNHHKDSFLFNKNLKDCNCTHFDYTLENQMRLKHKQIELINENLPLSFEILDRCQAISATNSTNSAFFSACNPDQSMNVRPPSGPPPPVSQKPNSCTCTSLMGEQTNKNKLKSKFKSPKLNSMPKAIKTEPSTTVGSNFDLLNESADIKQSPFSLNTFSTKLTNPLNQQSLNKNSPEIIKSEKTDARPASKPQQKPSKHFNVSTLVDQPFHRRQCYFNKHRPNRFRQSRVVMAKTIQLANKETNPKYNPDRAITSQIINVKDAEYDKLYSR